ncbi:flagellar protein FliO/FliZ [Luteimonas terrae]|uniref:Flagellar protein n=1 Tax=Luteimonas terrae TaxID=1530191 RepID=A0ABU1XUX8_9GAMM|nr:flagellar protein FliO/FliZ [Luteimonas terrae]
MTPARVEATAAEAALPSIAAEIGLEPEADAAPSEVDADTGTTALATGEDGAAEADGPADFSLVVASTTAPARANDTIASVAPPAKPIVIGAHAPQGPGLGGAFLALVLVLGLIVGLAWLLKRLPGGGFRQADGLRIVASIPLGAKERAAVVQVGDQQLLLGIGAGGVRTLHVLPQPLPEAPPAQMPTLKNLPDFKQLLAQRLRKDT